MSARTQIQKALIESLKEKLNGASPYVTNLSGRIDHRLRYWDEINDFPFICVVTGTETREYLPGNFKWGRIYYCIKTYVNSENPGEDLEDVMADVERAIDANINLQYDLFNPTVVTTDIRVESITTDEGSLAPYGVGEITIEVLYNP
jgi:hypothetical protein